MAQYSSTIQFLAGVCVGAEGPGGGRGPHPPRLQDQVQDWQGGWHQVLATALHYTKITVKPFWLSLTVFVLFWTSQVLFGHKSVLFDKPGVAGIVIRALVINNLLKVI